LKNSYKEDGEYVIIYIIHKGTIYECIIDKINFEIVNSFNTTWHLNINRSGHLDGIRTKVQTDKVRKQIWIHRLIINCPDELIVDHIDGNIFNNTILNLRIANFSINGINSKLDKNSLSGVRNVYLEKGKYSVRINNVRYGRFNSIEEAIKIANEMRAIVFPECKRKLSDQLMKNVN